MSEADNNKRGSHRRAGNHQDHRRQKQGENKAHRRGQRGQTGASPGLDSGSTFNIADDGGCSQQRADDRRGGVCHEGPADSRNIALSIHEARAARHPDQRPNVVEHIHKQERQDYRQGFEMIVENEVEVELEEGRF